MTVSIEQVQRACDHEVTVNGEQVEIVVLIALALRQSDAANARIDNEDEVFIRAISVVQEMLEAAAL